MSAAVGVHPSAAAVKAYQQWFASQQTPSAYPPASAEVQAKTRAKTDQMWVAFYTPLVNNPALLSKSLTLVADMFYGLHATTVFQQLGVTAKHLDVKIMDKLFYDCELALLDSDAYNNPSADLAKEDMTRFLPSKVRKSLGDSYDKYGGNSPKIVGQRALETIYNLWFATDSGTGNDWFDDLYPGALEEVLERFPLTQIASILGEFLHQYGQFTVRKTSH